MLELLVYCFRFIDWASILTWEVFGAWAVGPCFGDLLVLRAHDRYACASLSCARKMHGT